MCLLGVVMYEGGPLASLSRTRWAPAAVHFLVNISFHRNSYHNLAHFIAVFYLRIVVLGSIFYYGLITRWTRDHQPSPNELEGQRDL